VRYRSFRGQDRTIRAITTQIPRAAAIPIPMTQPKVADSGKGDTAVSVDHLGLSMVYAHEDAWPSLLSL
jgi:hypothetical protein